MGCWHLLVHFILMFLTSSSATAELEASIAKPGCPDKCGNVTIPYPFGIKDGCFRDDQYGFQLICNDTYDPPRPFLGDYYFLGISLEGEATVTAYVVYDCYNQSGYSDDYFEFFMEFTGTPIAFSNTRNKFFAVGCDTQAYISSPLEPKYTSGCLSFCWDKDSVENGACSGIGCCQTSIPAGAKRFNITVNSSNDHSDVWNFNPCSYAFLMKEDEFQFNLSDLTNTGRYSTNHGGHKEVPVVVDWAIDEQTCESALKNSTSYACKSVNSACHYTENGPGYRCKCFEGFRGNPYLKEGCKDIDECREKTDNCSTEGICHNTEGSFTCSCPKGSHGDGINKCTPDPKPDPPPPASKSKPDIAKIILSVGSSLLFVLIAGSWIYWALQKREFIKLKEKFFQQNGGMLLQQQINSHEGASVRIKIFTAEELEKATDKYDESRIIGRGGYGTVYKGILSDHRVVAIKKSKIVDESQIEQFINEVFILSQINHRNVVKLLGCCLETEVPLLVYEFISSGTLFHHIHDEANSSSLSLENRLRIASETAGALAYLHSATSVPIFHRDVKSTNILLDDSLTAKVSDFGASRLVPLDQNQITTLVQGTLGYLDPEYFHTGQLTEKSDVYSFGVVLVELLTGEMPICSSRSKEERNLPMHFISSMRQNRLFHILEERVVEEGKVEQLVEIAELANRCLRLKGEERPTMKEVSLELEGLRRLREHLWVERNDEETQGLLCWPSDGYNCNDNIVGQESLGNHAISISALDIGR